MRKLFLVALAACNSSTATSPDASDGTLAFTGTTTSLAADTEAFTCWDFAIDASITVTGLHVALPNAGLHHYALTVAPGTAKTGAYDCNGPTPGGFNAITLAIGGLGADTLGFPSGAGLTLDGGNVVTLQMHLLNASDAAIDVAAPGVTLQTSHATDLQRVGVVAAVVPFNQIDLPAHATNVQAVASCALPALDHVFAAYLHAHTLATDIAADVSPATPARIVEANPWNFDQQKVYPLDTSIVAGTNLAVTCTYSNGSNAEVVGGQLSSNEMCMGLLYYYPATQNVVNCISGGMPPM